MTDNIIDTGDGYVKVEKKFFDEVMNAVCQNLMFTPEEVKKNKMLKEFFDNKKLNKMQLQEAELPKKANQTNG